MHLKTSQNGLNLVLALKIFSKQFIEVCLCWHFFLKNKIILLLKQFY